MISGGNATVYVTDMDESIRFYTEVLGLELDQRYGNEWAEVKAPDGFVVGLHPQREGDLRHRPGNGGSIQVGFNVHGRLEEMVDALKAKGVRFKGGIMGDEPESPVRLAFLGDPDGNEIYLCETKPR